MVGMGAELGGEKTLATKRSSRSHLQFLLAPIELL